MMINSKKKKKKKECCVNGEVNWKYNSALNKHFIYSANNFEVQPNTTAELVHTRYTLQWMSWCHRVCMGTRGQRLVVVFPGSSPEFGGSGACVCGAATAQGPRGGHAVGRGQPWPWPWLWLPQPSPLSLWNTCLVLCWPVHLPTCNQEWGLV